MAVPAPGKYGKVCKNQEKGDVAVNGIFGNNMSLAETSLDSLWARQQATMNNIANADTPGYQARFVTFEEELRKKIMAARKGTPQQVRQAITGSGYRIQQSRDESARLDGNNVNVDVEQVELARAVFQYQFEINALNGDISRLRTVLK